METKCFSAVQESDSVMRINSFWESGDMLVRLRENSNILFHYGLSQDIKYSSLCHTVGPYCLSILYVIVCIC